jgi:hypothetical protein
MMRFKSPSLLLEASSIPQADAISTLTTISSLSNERIE